MAAEYLKWAVLVFASISALFWFKSSDLLPEAVKNRDEISSYYGKAAAIFALLTVACQVALNFSL